MRKIKKPIFIFIGIISLILLVNLVMIFIFLWNNVFFYHYSSEPGNLPRYPASTNISLKRLDEVDEAITSRANCEMDSIVTFTLLATKDPTSKVYDYYSNIADNLSKQSLRIVKDTRNFGKTICYFGKSNNIRRVPRASVTVLDNNDSTNKPLINAITNKTPGITSDMTILLILEGEFIGD